LGWEVSKPRGIINWSETTFVIVPLVSALITPKKNAILLPKIHYNNAITLPSVKLKIPKLRFHMTGSSQRSHIPE